MGHDPDSERDPVHGDGRPRAGVRAGGSLHAQGHAHGRAQAQARAEEHGHRHGHHHRHAHPARSATDRNVRRLAVTLALVVGYMVAEVVGGILSNSLALLADAGHMLSDAGALALSLLAMSISRRPPSTTHTFGYQRAEILAALVNGALLVAISGAICFAAYHRIGDPPAVRGGLMMAVSAGGLAVNLAGLWILHGGRSQSLNVRGAWLHVLSDALGSLGAIAAAFAISAFGWNWADPAASLAIAVLVIFSAWSLLRSTVGVLMQAVPSHIDIAAVHTALASISGVREVHDLHVWSVTSGKDVVSAHVTAELGADREAVMSEVQRRLREGFELRHSTIQLDIDPAMCHPCPPPTARGSAG